jgi:micrococcal nuclease
MRRTFLLLAGLVLLTGCGDQPVQPSQGQTSVGATPVSPTPDENASRLLSPPERAESRKPRHDETPTRVPDGRNKAAKAVATEDAPRRRAHMHRVLDVVDGDTVTVDYRGSEVSVRVIGIDTPETVHPSEPVECGGPQASAAATRLLAGKKVRLVFDPSQGRTDYYGRTLAYLEAPGVGDFGLAMVRQGRAAEYTYDTDYARQTRYLNAQDNAQAHRHGIWSRCGGVDTPLRRSKPAPAHQTRPGGSTPQGGGCDPGYDPCIPPYPPDLDCGDVDGPIQVTGDDPHGFDADGDGIGCDS